MVDYTPTEQKALELMGRTNFAHIRSSEMIGLCSQLAECRPEVARDIIAQFPEFARLVSSSLNTYKDILGNVIESDDKSAEHVYAAIDKDIDALDSESKEFFSLASRVQADMHRCLKDSKVSSKDKRKIIDQEMDLIRQVGEKDTETKERRRAAVHIADRKDSEVRTYHRDAIHAATTLTLCAVGAGLVFLGGKGAVKLLRLL